MDLFNLSAILTLDTSQYEQGIDRAEALGTALTSGVGTAFKVGTAAIAAAGTAVAGFGAKSVQVGMSFDSAMSQVQATMLKTDEEMEQSIGSVDTAYGHFEGNLRDFAKFLGKETAFSASQAAQALNYMALAGYDTQQSMDMLPNVLSLAAAGGMELARASDMVTDAQSAFGLDAQRTTLMVQEMAKAASTGNTNVEQLGDAFLVVGGLAKQMNGGFIQTQSGAYLAVDGLQQMEIAMTAMANAGIKGSEAGTHMRNIITKLSDPTSDGAARMEELGVQIFDAEGKMRSFNDIFGDLNASMQQLSQEEQIQTITDLFNARDLASAEALLAAVGQDWNRIGASILDAQMPLEAVNGAIQETGINFEQYGISGAESMDALAGAIRYDLTTALNDAGETGKSVEDTAKDIAEAYGISLPDATAAVEAVNTALQATKGSAEEMANIQQENLGGALTKFRSALEGVHVAISEKVTPALTEFVKIGTSGMSELTDAINAGNMSEVMDVFSEMLSNGIAAITSMLPDVIAIGVNIIGALVQGIADNLPQIAEAGLEIMTMLFDSISAVAPNVVTFLWEGIVTGLPMLTEGAIQIMQTLGDGISQAIPELLPVALNALMTFSGQLRENAGQLVDAGIEMVLKIAQGLIDSLPVIIETVPTIVTNIAGIINDNAPKLIAGGITLIGNLVTGIINAAPTIIAEFPKIVKSIFSVITAVNWLALGGNIITGIARGVKSLATQIPQALKNIGTQAMQWMKLIQWNSLGRDIIDLILIGLRALATSIPQTLKSIGMQAMAAFKSINWLSLGTNIISGIVSGVTGGAGRIAEAAKNAAKNAFEAAKNFLGIKSPSRLFRDQVGKMISAGMALGIEDGEGAVLSAIEGLNEDLDNIDDVDYGTDFSVTKKKSESDNGIDRLVAVMESMLAMMSEMDEAMEARLLAAFERMKLQVNGREFGRLVRDVRTA